MAVNRGPDNGRVVETDVEIMTPDGSCDAAFTHPSSGSHPAVLLWADAFGLRPSMRAMAKRLAAGGYAVLVPNPFYRLTKAPFTDASKMNFSNPADMAKLRPLLETAKAPGHVETDAVAFFEFLDAQKAVNPKRKAGAHGYCMGGLLSLKTAARLPQRVGAAASFHGGGLVTDGPDSPHLLAHKIKAHIYVGIAENDDARSRMRRTNSVRRSPRRGCRPRSRCIRTRCMDGAFRTCRPTMASRSTTRRRPSARGAN